MQNTYSPNDYKHLENDSAMIQAAIDEAAKYGAKVEIINVKYLLSRLLPMCYVMGR